MLLRSWLLAILAILLSGQALSVFGQAPAAPATESAHHPFLKPGSAYLVRFPPDRDLFQHVITGFAEVTSLDARGEVTQLDASGKRKSVEQRPYTAKVRLEIFKVVRLGGGSWVLMEYPASSEDYASWTGKYRAAAILSQTESPESGDNRDAQDRIRKLREAAARDLPTTKTWINLDHAITISELSARSLGIDSDD